MTYVDSEYIWYIWNWFYTKQEERKLKLERINNADIFTI